MNVPQLRRAIAVAVAVTVAACGDFVTAPGVEEVAVTSPAPTVQADQDVAVSAAAALAGSVAALTSDEAAAGLTLPGAALLPSGIRAESSPGGTGDTETATFGDRTETKSVTRAFTFYNAAGAVMSSFVRGTTASVRAIVTANMRLTKDSTYVSASYSRKDHTLSGLLGDRRIWNGTATSADTTSHRDGSGTRTYVGTAADTTTAVTFLADRAVNKYPLSGTSVRVVNYVKTFTGKETGTLTVTRRIVVTFNGTSSAVMKIGNVTCTLNLDTRKAEHCT